VMRSALRVVLGLVCMAGCAPDPFITQPIGDLESFLVTPSEREKERLNWRGYQTDPKDRPDHLITGVVAKVGENYKWITITLDNPRAVVEPGDIFLVFKRLDDFVKRNRRAHFHHHDFRSVRVRVTSVQGEQVTGDIDPFDSTHTVAEGDRAVARTF
jgi:hypothetical protein